MLFLWLSFCLISFWWMSFYSVSFWSRHSDEFHCYGCYCAEWHSTGRNEDRMTILLHILFIVYLTILRQVNKCFNQHLPKMLDSDIILLEAVVVGHFPEFCEVDGGAAAHQLLHLLRPEHDQSVGGADRVKAEIESPEMCSKNSLAYFRGTMNNIYTFMLKHLWQWQWTYLGYLGRQDT